MTRNRRRLLPCLAAFAVAVALSLPAISSAHQTVTISNGELVVLGDKTKPTDLVTITYDSVKDEYLIGHDIEDPIPPECYRDAVEPFHILHCPAKGITRIRVELGGGKDTFRQENIIEIVSTAGVPNGALILPKDLVSIEIHGGTDNDRYEEDELKTAELAAKELRELAELEESESKALIKVSMGSGADTVTLRRGASSVDFDGTARLTVLGGANQVDVAQGGSSLVLAGGANVITVGPGNSKATASAGNSRVTFGPGNSAYTATGGTNVVVFGGGNSVFSGGSGDDSAFFGTGNNAFSGGAGSDSVSLGLGKDTASGGPGRDLLRGGPGKDILRGGADADTLFGGPAKDTLFGGPAFDRLFGGPSMDLCFPGGPGLEVGCELP